MPEETTLPTALPPPIFTVGETVKLKSGGPFMTILTYSDTPDGHWVHCRWFVGTTLQQGDFPESALTK